MFRFFATFTQDPTRIPTTWMLSDSFTRSLGPMMQKLFSSLDEKMRSFLIGVHRRCHRGLSLRAARWSNTVAREWSEAQVQREKFRCSV
jgi:hypothetical protein